MTAITVEQINLNAATGSPTNQIRFTKSDGTPFEQKWDWTPWGRPDRIESILPGIDHYATPSHGGFFLAAERNSCIDPGWRQVSGWYEEDAERAILVFTFRTELGTRWGDFRRAIRTLKYFYAGKYTNVTGRAVPFEKTFESKVQRLPDGTTKRREERDSVPSSSVNSQNWEPKP